MTDTILSALHSSRQSFYLDELTWIVLKRLDQDAQNAVAGVLAQLAECGEAVETEDGWTSVEKMERRERTQELFA